MICFDTDVLSAAVRTGGGPSQLARRLGLVPAAAQVTTSISVAELLYGARKRRSERLERDIEALVSDIEVVPFDARAARSYADIRFTLESEGRRLEDPDLHIAAICLAREFTLVTGNVRHFERVPGLRVENWLT